MVKIRLKLKGRKNAPSYRVVVIDSKKKRDGKYIEDLGYFNPIEKTVLLNIDKDRYNYWISKGAQASESVKKIVEGKYKFVKYNPKASKEAENSAPEEVEAPNDSAETSAANVEQAA